METGSIVQCVWPGRKARCSQEEARQRTSVRLVGVYSLRLQPLAEDVEHLAAHVHVEQRQRAVRHVFPENNGPWQRAIDAHTSRSSLEDQHTGIDQSAAATQVHRGGTHEEHSLPGPPQPAPPPRSVDAAPKGSLRPKAPTLRGPSDQLGSSRCVDARAAEGRWWRQRWKLHPATAARQSTLRAVHDPMSR